MSRDAVCSFSAPGNLLALAIMSGDVRRRGVGGADAVPLLVPGQQQQQQPQRVGDASQQALLADPLPTSKGAPGRFQFEEWGTAFIWAPFHRRPFRFMPYALTLLIGLLLALTLSLVVTVTASTANSATVAINAFVVGFWYMVALLLGMSYRAADGLPQHMHPGLSFSEMLHGKFGLIIAVPMMAVMLAGSAIGAPILTAIGGTNLPNYAAAARPITFWGAVGFQTALTALAIYAYQQNTAVKHFHLLYAVKEKRGVQRAFKKTALFFSMTTGLAVTMGYANGLYSVGNYIVTFGSYINTGSWNVPDTGACTLDLAWPFVAAAVAWALHLLTWNVNGLVMGEVQEAAGEEEEAGGAEE